MEWNDEAIVLSLRRHGESGAIAELLTRDHGRHMGLVHGGSRKNNAYLQPGTSVRATWRARLEEHLGTYTIEPAKSRAELIFGSAYGLAALTSACAVLSVSVPEREQHRPLYDAFEVLADQLDDPDVWPALYVRWELGVLAELGFGLELEKCAVSGISEDLTHVSPRSGKAVCRAEAAPYKGRLLNLPDFLGPNPSKGFDSEDIFQGLLLAGHFLEARLWRNHGAEEPEARRRLVNRVEKLARSPRISD